MLSFLTENSNHFYLKQFNSLPSSGLFPDPLSLTVICFQGADISVRGSGFWSTCCLNLVLAHCHFQNLGFWNVVFDIIDFSPQHVMLLFRVLPWSPDTRDPVSVILTQPQNSFPVDGLVEIGVNTFTSFWLTHTKGLSFDFSVRAYSLTHCGIVHSSHRTRGMEVGKWGQSQQAQGCQNSGLAMTSLLPRGLKLSRAALVTTQSHSKLSSRAQYKAVSSSEKFLLWNPLPLHSLHLNGQLLVYPYTQKEGTFPEEESILQELLRFSWSHLGKYSTDSYSTPATLTDEVIRLYSLHYRSPSYAVGKGKFATAWPWISTPIHL